MCMRTIIDEIRLGMTIPVLGLGIFHDWSNNHNEPLVYDTASMALALNEGRVSSPRLMGDYARMAMAIEQKKGRRFLEERVCSLYDTPYEPTPAHQLIALLKPQWCVDLTYDTMLASLYGNESFQLLSSKARVLGDGVRYELYDVCHGEYTPTVQRLESPLLHKLYGTYAPMNLIVSDADFVDFLTELISGFGVPSELKSLRKGKKFLLLGVSLSKDTNRMALNELMLDGVGGYSIAPLTMNKSEKRFYESHHMTLIQGDEKSFIEGLLHEVQHG